MPAYFKGPAHSLDNLQLGIQMIMNHVYSLAFSGMFLEIKITIEVVKRRVYKG